MLSSAFANLSVLARYLLITIFFGAAVGALAIADQARV